MRQLDATDYTNLIETVKEGTNQAGTSSESAKNFAILKRYTTKQIRTMTIPKRGQIEDDRVKSAILVRKDSFENVVDTEEKSSETSSPERQISVVAKKPTINMDRKSTDFKELEEGHMMIDQFLTTFKANEAPYENLAKTEKMPEIQVEQPAV